jgi:hypothetical protein
MLGARVIIIIIIMDLRVRGWAVEGQSESSWPWREN